MGLRDGDVQPAPALAALNLKPSSFKCERAALPPRIMDPVTFQAHPPGYVVMDATACVGTVFEAKCYCWDDFKLLAGEDPLTSEMFCGRRPPDTGRFLRSANGSVSRGDTGRRGFSGASCFTNVSACP